MLGFRHILETNYKNDTKTFILIIKFFYTENFRGNSAYGLNLVELKLYILFSTSFFFRRMTFIAIQHCGSLIRESLRNFEVNNQKNSHEYPPDMTQSSDIETHVCQIS